MSFKFKLTVSVMSSSRSFGPFKKRISSKICSWFSSRSSGIRSDLQESDFPAPNLPVPDLTESCAQKTAENIKDSPKKSLQICRSMFSSTESLPTEQPIADFNKRRTSGVTMGEMSRVVKRSRSNSFFKMNNDTTTTELDEAEQDNLGEENWSFGRVGNNLFKSLRKSKSNSKNISLYKYRKHSVLSGTSTHSSKDVRVALHTVNFIAKLKMNVETTRMIECFENGKGWDTH